MDKAENTSTFCSQNIQNDSSQSSKKIFFWRILNCIMGIFFMIAMGLQANDPDPAVWMLLYGITGLVSFSIVISPPLQGKRLWRVFVAIYFVCCLAMLAYVIMFYSNVIEKSSNILHNEEGRELSGVILVQLWLAITLSVSMNHDNINNLLLYEWLVIISGVGVPLFCTFFLYGTIDQSTLPEHCRGILQRWMV